MSPNHLTSPDIDDVNHNMSTAPTTPDGSLTFSPILQALSLDDGIAFGSAISSETYVHRLVENIFMTRPKSFIDSSILGGPTAAILALQNPAINFTVVDKDSSRVKEWNSRHLPIHEPGLPEIIRICRDGSRDFSFFNGPLIGDADPSFERFLEHNDNIHIPARSPNLFFSDNIEMCLGEADLIMIAVNTPTKTYGIGAGKATDMTAVESVVRDIGKYAKAGAIIVEKSTVPGRTGDFITDTLRVHRPHETFPIISNPEFLSAGTAVTDLLYPDRILIGTSRDNHDAAMSLASLYHWVPLSKIIHTATSSSELAKLVSNAMLAQRISSINSISAICECIGADIGEVSKAVGMDRRIGERYLKAGIGFGGSCFGKDVRNLMYLAGGLGLEEVVIYWESVLRINEWQINRWVERMVGCMGGGLRGKKIVVVGYAFKKGTGDVRESLAREVVDMLGEERPGEIVVWDDGCEVGALREELKKFDEARVEENLYTACEGADAILICRELETPSKQTSLPVGDPRPFSNNPSEMDLLNLRNFLWSESEYSSGDDPLGRLYPEPSCEENCRKCEQRGKTNTRQEEKIEWKRIIKEMNAPRWIFDGRGVVDRAGIEKIGKDVGVEVRVVGVGVGMGRSGW
ncbi:UDP-glucose 6-dehydrogenase [Sclerotinia borealis F-4128]|uniref:UDP-glucose 6-dehydrogenase n=1 Tax=Sclerotinia borealis (strain F-4128) TaxID=1432307 RepID=W9CDI1_SCLBF|nr:UDP-glucose 6-dehydrogenase [Sclerotinia borealis F-4128]